MDTLYFRDVRCFRGDHEAPLAPLTLLVGENSTGKSTVLALTRIAWDLVYGVSEPNFNEDPFSLGAYDDMAHYHGGRGKRAKAFSVGVRLASPRSTKRTASADPLQVNAVFESSAGQPDLTQLKVAQGGVSVSAAKAEDGLQVEFSSPSGTVKVAPKHRFLSATLNLRNLFFILEPLLYRELRTRQRDLFEGLPENVSEFLPLLDRMSGIGYPSGTRRPDHWARPLATAPIRSRPKRTYDPLQEARSPEGDHIPMFLARLASTTPDAWTALESSLAKYGRGAGLFEDVVVRRFGKSDSAPFQLRVRLAGQQKEANIVDVGYGVSQVLPILVEALAEQSPAMFLLQQPEVHLHPRAQAELGSFFAKLVKDRHHRFIIETHSDYIVDRVRMAVRDGALPKSAVSLLFLTSRGGSTDVQALALDDEGNIESAPPHYRDFFLKEELRLLTAET